MAVPTRFRMNDGFSKAHAPRLLSSDAAFALPDIGLVLAMLMLFLNSG
jgi:hypothetical protein